MNYEKKFYKNHQRPFFWTQTDGRRFLIFFLFIFIITSTTFYFKANKYKHYKKITLSEHKMKQIYLNYANSQKMAHLNMTTQTARVNNIDIKKLVNTKEVSKNTIDFSPSQKNIFYDREKIKLLTEDSLPNILNSFVANYNTEKKEIFESKKRSRQFLEDIQAITSIVTKSFIGKKYSNIKFGEKVKTKLEYENYGYRTNNEIKKINSLVKKQELLYKSCILKYQRKKYNYKKASFFLKIRFLIDNKGRIRKESIKIVETNIKDEAFLNCIIRRTKYFYGFPHASLKNATDYTFQKKYIF